MIFTLCCIFNNLLYYINLFANYRDTLIEKDHLLAIQEALVGFLMDEVVNP
jgi:hypothetical protein